MWTRRSATRVRSRVAAIAIALTAAAPLSAITSPVGRSELDRALSTARSRDAERTRFHAAYIFPLNASLVQRVEVVTEFRRAVLITEEHLKQGDWIFGQGGRNLRGENAADALKPAEGRVTIRAHLEFGPHSTLAMVPLVEIVVDGSPRLMPLDTRTIPLSSLPVPLVGGRSGQTTTVLVGADVETDFDASQFGPGERQVRVLVAGGDGARLTIPFGKLD